MFKLQIINGDKLAAAFRAAPGVAAKAFDAALERTVNFVQSEAFNNAPVGKGYKGGGNLRQSIRTKRLATAQYQVIVNASYGAAVDQGSRPHVIVPKRKKVLAFQKEGRWIVTKRVNHPGTKAQPFFTNAVKAAEPYANKQLSDAADEVFNSL